MIYYGNYNDDGKYLGFYVKEIHGKIPTPNVKLTEEEWQQALSGNYRVEKGKHTHFELPPITREEALVSVRSERNRLLSESDWTQYPDVKLTKEEGVDWVTYRQALRDMIATCDANDPIFPIKPTKA
jgi:hypothetical protein